MRRGRSLKIWHLEISGPEDLRRRDSILFSIILNSNQGRKIGLCRTWLIAIRASGGPEDGIVGS